MCEGMCEGMCECVRGCANAIILFFMILFYFIKQSDEQMSKGTRICMCMCVFRCICTSMMFLKLYF